MLYLEVKRETRIGEVCVKFLYCTSDRPLAPLSHAGSPVDLRVSQAQDEGLVLAAGDTDGSAAGGESDEEGEIVCFQLGFSLDSVDSFPSALELWPVWALLQSCDSITSSVWDRRPTPKDMEIPALVGTFRNCCL